MNHKKKAESLIQAMYSFIPIKSPTGSAEILSAKFCARAACKEIVNAPGMPREIVKDYELVLNELK